MINLEKEFSVGDDNEAILDFREIDDILLSSAVFGNNYCIC